MAVQLEMVVLVAAAGWATQPSVMAATVGTAATAALVVPVEMPAPREQMVTAEPAETRETPGTVRVASTERLPPQMVGTAAMVAIRERLEPAAQRALAALAEPPVPSVSQ